MIIPCAQGYGLPRNMGTPVETYILRTSYRKKQKGFGQIHAHLMFSTKRVYTKSTEGKARRDGRNREWIMVWK